MIFHKKEKTLSLRPELVGSCSRLKTNGEVTKMFLVEFYRDLLMAAADNQPLSPKSILDKMLIRYWL